MSDRWAAYRNHQMCEGTMCGHASHLLRQVEGLIEQSDQWQKEANVRREEAQKYAEALVKIKRITEFKQCDHFDVCTHRSCGATYDAWAIADAVLKGEPIPV